MKIINYLLIILAAVTFSCSSKNPNQHQIHQKADIQMPYLNDGWPAGLPKDTVVVVYRNYPESMKTFILQQANRNPDWKGIDLKIVEVCKNRSWDGEKWSTSENDFSALIENKKQPEQKSVIGFERNDDEYKLYGWYIAGSK